MTTASLPGRSLLALAALLSLWLAPAANAAEHPRVLTEEQSFLVKHAGIERRVFWLGGKGGRVAQTPAIVLIHELNGLTPDCVALAQRLQTRGYTVYLPLLFGQPERENTGLGIAHLSTHPGEWLPFTSWAVSPITTWLRGVCRQVDARHAGSRIGVIGMGMSGAFPIALMTERCVVAPVVAQPALPLGRGNELRDAALGISRAEFKAARERAERDDLQVLGLRFEHDGVSKRAKFEMLRAGFGERFIDREIRDWEYERARPPISKKAHATLTTSYVDRPGHPTRKRFEEMVAFLDERLK